jgi:hypothetical protein
MNHDNLKVFSADGLNNIKQRVSYPSDNPIIWKFVDLSTFLTILTDSCLFFSSINNLCSGDPFECALWPSQRYNSWTKDQHAISLWCNLRFAPGAAFSTALDGRRTSTKLFFSPIEKKTANVYLLS